MNATQHRVLGTAGVTIITLAEEYQQTGTISEESFIAFLVAFNTSSLPDWIEPAHHPRHRAFFHSIAFALGLSVGIYKAYQWQPKNQYQRWGRRLMLTLGIGYLIHLLADSTTPMGLPVI